MASSNIATDLALIIFPISFLRQAGLDISRYIPHAACTIFVALSAFRFIRLGILFALGSLIIITTIVRLPIILRTDAQKTRSLVRHVARYICPILIYYLVGQYRNSLCKCSRQCAILPSRVDRYVSQEKHDHPFHGLQILLDL